MTSKQAFLALTLGDRRRIGYLVAGISIINIVQFLIAPPGTTVGRWGAIAGNALVMYWSVRPERAPGIWFTLLPYGWWIAAIIDGMAVGRGLLRGQKIDATLVLSAMVVLMLPFLGGPLLRLHRLSKTESIASSL